MFNNSVSGDEMSFKGVGQGPDRPSVRNGGAHLGPAKSPRQGTAENDSGETFWTISSNRFI